MVVALLITTLAGTLIALGVQVSVNRRLRSKVADMHASGAIQSSLLSEVTARVLELERKTEPNALTPEQEKFKSKLESQWKKVVDDLKRAHDEQLATYKANFDAKVKAEYEKAVESIAFHTVEYKKSITKKRKETSRKTKATKAAKEYRSIDDE